MIGEPISICEGILKRHGATEIYVFGTHSKRTSTAESDLDLAVTGIDERKYFHILGELMSAVHGAVDLVLLNDGLPFAEHRRIKIERGWLKRVA
jgi:predicted nucleotidyltransferase